MAKRKEKTHMISIRVPVKELAFLMLLFLIGSVTETQREGRGLKKIK